MSLRQFVNDSTAALTEAITEDVVRGIVFVALTLTACYLFITTNRIPAELLAVWSAVLGYYFGRTVTHGGE